MQNAPKGRKALGFGLALGLAVVTAGAAVTAVSAQPARSPNVSVDPNVNPKPGARYFVDFRARTAASYGHAFVWYGRVGERRVEVAGLHPSGDVLPYILGHIMLVPAETGASYGDLDDQYLTAHYRIVLTEAQAKKVFAYIKDLQHSRPVWNAATFNCVSFIQDIARYMGLELPSSHLLMPETWVTRLKELNGKNPKLRV